MGWLRSDQKWYHRVCFSIFPLLTCDPILFILPPRIVEPNRRFCSPGTHAWTNVRAMLDQRLRRWPNIARTLVWHLVLGVSCGILGTPVPAPWDRPPGPSHRLWCDRPPGPFRRLWCAMILLVRHISHWWSLSWNAVLCLKPNTLLYPPPFNPLSSKLPYLIFTHL